MKSLVAAVCLLALISSVAFAGGNRRDRDQADPIQGQFVQTSNVTARGAYPVGTRVGGVYGSVSVGYPGNFGSTYNQNLTYVQQGQNWNNRSGYQTNWVNPVQTNRVNSRDRKNDRDHRSNGIGSNHGHRGNSGLDIHRYSPRVEHNRRHESRSPVATLIKKLLRH